MDEPTSSLEAREVDTLFNVIKLLHDQDVSVVYVTHRLEELFRICDQVTVLRDGSVVHTGPIAGMTRSELVGHMLGRELTAVKARRAASQHEAVDERSALRVTGLSRRHVLHDIDLAVRPGEVLGLGGLLGAGRTETARAIVGVDRSDAGEVRVEDTTIRTGSTAASVKVGLAMLPEDRRREGIIPDLSIRDNLVLAALPSLSRAGIVSDSRIDEIVATFMRRLGIKASGPQQKVKELSGGNQQKVMLARWLCIEPKVLILDEPTRGIDVGAKAEIRELINELAELGLALVFISSEVDEVAEESDDVVVLREGRVVDHLHGDAVTEDALVAVLAAGDGVAPGSEAGSTRAERT